MPESNVDPVARIPEGVDLTDLDLWSVHSHAACMTVVHDPGAFSSETGGTRPFGGTTLNDLPVAGPMLNMMDDPRHQRVRMLVSKGLTSRMIARLEDDLRARVGEIELTGPVEWTRSNKHTGIRHLPVRLARKA
jgi:cytochrome P450